MPLIRARHQIDTHFAQIRNQWLRDSRLSLKARGLFAQLMTHEIGWEMSIESLATQNQEGRDSIRSAIRELEKFGYLIRTQKRAEHNRYGEVVYETNDPFDDQAEKPSAEKPSAEKATLKNTNIKEQQLKEKNKPENYSQLFELFWESYPRKEGKIKAAKAFEKVLKDVDFDSLLAALTNWRNHPDKKDLQFWPHATTWLNERRFEDVLRSSNADGTPRPKILGDWR